jgi:hypothetical protein
MVCGGSAVAVAAMVQDEGDFFADCVVKYSALV